MTIQSITSGGSAAYERCGSATYERCGSAAPARKAGSASEKPQADEATARREPRRNPLVAAMMTAIKSLVPSSTTTASTASADKPATATQAAAPTKPAEDTSAKGSSLEEAALAFANALFGALRGGGESKNDGKGDGKPDKVHHHGHHGHHGWGRGGGWDDLAQRLESLAQKLEGKPLEGKPAATSAPSPTVTPAPTSAPASATPAAADTTAAAPASTAITSTSIKVAPPKAAVVAPASDESPLLSAFRQLFDALNPKKADGDKADAGAGKLVAFLRQVAQSLRAAGAETSAPATGSLISVAA